MTAVLNNNAVSRLASSLSSGATTLSVTTGEGAKFPAPSAGQWFPVTLIKSSGSLEIVRCTARSGDVLTVVRGQESTAAQSFTAGDRVELRFTAAAFTEVQTAADNAQTAADDAQDDADAISAIAVRKDAATTTGAAIISSGTTAQRPGAPSEGMLRQNTDTKETERYQDGKWLPFNVMDKALNEAPQVTLASASTVNIGAAAANTLNISGTISITAFDTLAAGAIRRLIFQAALTLTHNVTSLILPGGANILTVAGDIAEFVSLGSGNWRCIAYHRASGTATVAGLGFGQTRQDVSASRALNTTYTNTTPNPIEVTVSISSTTTGQLAITPTVGGMVQGSTIMPVTATGFMVSRTFVVQPNEQYSVSGASSSATPNIAKWTEMRV